MALIRFLKNNFLCKHPHGFDNIMLELVNIFFSKEFVIQFGKRKIGEYFSYLLLLAILRYLIRKNIGWKNIH